MTWGYVIFAYFVETECLDKSVVETARSVNGKIHDVIPKPCRVHTGRKRNDAARQAILDAVPALLAAADGTDITMTEIAAAAGVGKQTIYRWWPSRGVLLLDALSAWAGTEVPEPSGETLPAELDTFLRATFLAASTPPAHHLLCAILADAQRDPETSRLLAGFAETRRAAMRRIFDRARLRGEIADGTDAELLIDQAFGVLWYRLGVHRAPLTAESAARLAANLAECAADR
ncbi:TetR/AcrR family transcriptional regulator [Nocardia caishijiensis]|uniref:TetR/AcrR family transcriptional regulator n=1 Tax=Nocardia caishijiensis TaxID=184756 RepID=UPI001917289F|nr:TetR/AcrR family transcriptional regulator [Nocardia caishijiensis]